MRRVFILLVSAVAVAALALGIWLHGSRPWTSDQISSTTQLPDKAAPSSEESGMSDAVRAIHIDSPAEPNLQHSLSLLRTSDSSKPPVRILFYGQSITEQGWWMQVSEYLRHQYPNASLEIENRAIGAHASDRLVKTAEADLYPFQPDLVIFHVYGSHKKYEEIIRNIAQRTTSDILMASDHITQDREIREDTDSRRLWFLTWLYRTKLIGTPAQRDQNWEAWMNYDFLPSVAAKYHAQLADVRDPWKKYLVENGLKASQLLRDQVHLNQRGQDLMAAIIDSYLRPTSFKPNGADDDRVIDRSLPAGPDAAGDMLRVPFRGTRVDVLTVPGSQLDASFLVDGEPPCKLPAAYQFSRSSAYPGSNWPTLLRVQRGPTPLVAELWTITIEHPNEDLTDFSFKVSGSVTGDDGVGDSRHRFSSTSGRIVIDPDDWDLSFGKLVIKTDIPDHFQVTFSAQCLGSDALHVSSDSTTPSFRIVQGLSNGPHVIELPAAAAHSIKALQIYQPLDGRLP